MGSLANSVTDEAMRELFKDVGAPIVAIRCEAEPVIVFFSISGGWKIDARDSSKDVDLLNLRRNRPASTLGNSMVLNDSHSLSSHISR